MPFTLEESGMWLCLLAAARGCLRTRRLSGVEEGGWPLWCPLSTAPVGWQGVTATSECLGITPVTKFPLPPWPRGCWCTGWERNREFPSLNQGRRQEGSPWSFGGAPTQAPISGLESISFWGRRVASGCARAGGAGTSCLLPSVVSIITFPNHLVANYFRAQSRNSYSGRSTCFNIHMQLAFRISPPAY